MTSSRTGTAPHLWRAVPARAPQARSSGLVVFSADAAPSPITHAAQPKLKARPCVPAALRSRFYLGNAERARIAAGARVGGAAHRARPVGLCRRCCATKLKPSSLEPLELESKTGGGRAPANLSLSSASSLYTMPHYATLYSAVGTRPLRSWRPRPAKPPTKWRCGSEPPHVVAS